MNPRHAALRFALPLALFAPAARAQVFPQGGQDAPFAATISPPPTAQQRNEMQSLGGVAGPPFTLAVALGAALLPYERATFSARGVPRDAFAPYAPRDYAFTGTALGVRAPLSWTVNLVAHLFPVRPYLLGGGIVLGLGGAGGDAMASDMEAARVAQSQSVRFYQAALGPSLQISTGIATLRATLFGGVRASALAFEGLYDPSACTSTGCAPLGRAPHAWAFRPLLQARATVDLRATRLWPGASLVLGLYVAGEVYDGASVLFGINAGVRVDPRLALPSPPP